MHREEDIPRKELSDKDIFVFRPNANMLNLILEGLTEGKWDRDAKEGHGAMAPKDG